MPLVACRPCIGCHVTLLVMAEEAEIPDATAYY
jgi:hypothetical protein